MSKRTTDRIEALRRIPYLFGVREADLAALADVCSRRRVQKDGCLFTEGSPPTGLFLLESGRVKIVRQSAHGREQVLHEEGPGATLGEVPVFDGEGYVGTAVALEPCVVLFLPRPALLALLESDPGVARRVIEVLSRRVRRFARLAADLSLRGVTERVARHVLGEAERANGTMVSLDTTREELAARLGTVREEISRAFSTLRKERILDVERRRVTVLDMRRLRARAAGSTRVASQ